MKISYKRDTLNSDVHVQVGHDPCTEDFDIFLEKMALLALQMSTISEQVPEHIRTIPSTHILPLPMNKTSDCVWVENLSHGEVKMDE